MIHWRFPAVTLTPPFFLSVHDPFLGVLRLFMSTSPASDIFRSPVDPNIKVVKVAVVEVRGCFCSTPVALSPGVVNGEVGFIGR